MAGAPWRTGSELHEGNSLQDPDTGPGEEEAPGGVESVRVVRSRHSVMLRETWADVHTRQMVASLSAHGQLSE